MIQDSDIPRTRRTLRLCLTHLTHVPFAYDQITADLRHCCDIWPTELSDSPNRPTETVGTTDFLNSDVEHTLQLTATRLGFWVWRGFGLD